MDKFGRNVEQRKGVSGKLGNGVSLRKATQEKRKNLLYLLNRGMQEHFALGLKHAKL